MGASSSLAGGVGVGEGVVGGAVSNNSTWTALLSNSDFRVKTQESTIAAPKRLHAH